MKVWTNFSGLNDYFYYSSLLLIRCLLSAVGKVNQSFEE